MKRLFSIGACALLFLLSACTRTSIPTGYVSTAEPVKLMSEKDLKEKVDKIYDACFEAQGKFERLADIQKKETWLFNSDKVNMNQVEDFKKLYDEISAQTKAFPANGNNTSSFPSLKAYFNAVQEYMTKLQTTMDRLNTEIDKKEYEKLVKECQPDLLKIQNAALQVYLDYYTTAGDIDAANKYRGMLELPTKTKASNFDNNYGTVNMLCAHKDCNSPIAESGDSNCCEYHSARCEKCRCCIDEDLKYCMKCAAILKLDAFEKTTKKGTEGKK